MTILYYANRLYNLEIVVYWFTINTTCNIPFTAVSILNIPWVSDSLHQI